MSRLLGLLLFVVGVAYPFAVYFGIEHLPPRLFAILLAGLWLGRLLLGKTRPGQALSSVAALSFCALLWLSNEPSLLRWYPVLISTMLLVLFSLSLKYGPPLIERLARLSEPELPEVAVRYTRTVTQVWALFFLCNGLIATGLTLWAPLSWWTLYNGLISYVLVGLLFSIEWLIRQRVRRTV